MYTRFDPFLIFDFGCFVGSFLGQTNTNPRPNKLFGPLKKKILYSTYDSYSISNRRNIYISGYEYKNVGMRICLPNLRIGGI